MAYLQNAMTADPFSSQAWQQTQGAMTEALGQNLQGLASQLGAAGMLRGSGAQRYAENVTSNTFNQLAQQALGAGMQSEQMRLSAAQALPQLSMQLGQAQMGLASSYAGLNQQDIGNRMAALGLNMQAATGAEELRRSGKERSGGLLDFAAGLGNIYSSVFNPISL